MISVNSAKRESSSKVYPVKMDQLEEQKSEHESSSFNESEYYSEESNFKSLEPKALTSEELD